MRSSLIITLCLLTACSLGPEYKRPVLDQTQQIKFINQKSGTDAEWWTKLKDPVLSEWIQILEKNNFSLIAALERSKQARERLNIQEAAFFPTLGLSGSANRQQSVSGSFGALGSNINLGSRKLYNNNFSLNLNTSWQVDLFDQIGSSSSAAEAEFQATRFDQELIRQTLISELIINRIRIANLEKRQALSQEIINSRKITYDSIQRRYNAGAGQTSAFDLRLAKENLLTAEATLPSIEQELQTTYYYIDVLLGRTPGTTKKTQSQVPLIPAPEEIKIPIAGTLLDRRPDLLSNELRLIAAKENIGIALADLYPSLNISGQYGFQSLEFDDFIDPQQIVWQIGAALTSRIFEGGRLRANIRLQEARYRELEAQYLESILNALREVETALISEQSYQEEYQKLKLSLSELKSAETIAVTRYDKGLLSITDLLDIQRRRAQLEQQTLLSEFNVWRSRIDLYLALGGNWIFNGNKNDLQN